MTRLVEALQALGLEAEVSLAGRWVTIQGGRCRLHVLETPAGDGYYIWCDAPGDRAVQFYPDPDEAIREGLRRAAVRRVAWRCGQ
jgi:hypothetical protein